MGSRVEYDQRSAAKPAPIDHPATPLPKSSRIRARLLRYGTVEGRPLVRLDAGTAQGVRLGARGRIVGRPQSSFVVVEVDEGSCEISFERRGGTSTDGLTGYASFEIDRELPSARR